MHTGPNRRRIIAGAAATALAAPAIRVIPAQPSSGMKFAKADAVSTSLGLDSVELSLPPNFDSPAFSRRVLGLPDRVFCWAKCAGHPIALHR